MSLMKLSKENLDKMSEEMPWCMSKSWKAIMLTVTTSAAKVNRLWANPKARKYRKRANT